MAVPAVFPVTLPDPLMAAFEFDELHTPPGTASESKVVDPVHTAAMPDIVPAVGARPTVTTSVADIGPQPPVTV